MLHGFNFSKLVFLSILVFTHSKFLTFFNTRDLYFGCAAHTQSNWCFCSCELPCRSVECVLLHCFNAQPYIFALWTALT